MQYFQWFYQNFVKSLRSLSEVLDSRAGVCWFYLLVFLKRANEMLLILLGTYFSSFENTFLFKYFDTDVDVEDIKNGQVHLIISEC